VYVYACVSAHILYLNFNPFLCCCLSAWLAIILCYPFYAVCPLPAVLLLLDCANIIPAVSALLCLCLVVNTFCGTFVSLLGFFAVYVMYPHPPPPPPSLNLLRAHVCEWINTCIRAFMRMCMLLAGSAFTIAFCLHYTVDTMWCLLILLQLVHPVHNTPRCRRRRCCCCCCCFCRHTQTQYNTLSFALAIVALRNQCALSLVVGWDCKWRFALPAFAAHSPQRTGCDCLSACPSHSYSHSPKTAFGLISRLFGFVWFGFSALAQRCCLCLCCCCCCSAPSLNSSWLLACLLVLLGWLATDLSPVLFVAIAVAGWFAFDFSC